MRNKKICLNWVASKAMLKHVCTIVVPNHAYQHTANRYGVGKFQQLAGLCRVQTPNAPDREEEQRQADDADSSKH